MTDKSIEKHNIRISFEGKISLLDLLLAMLIFTVGVVLIALFSTSVMDGINRMVIMLLLTICIYKGRREKYLFNPYYFFAITPLSLLLYIEAASPYYLIELNQGTWNTAILNISMFIIGLSILKSNNKSMLDSNIRYKDKYRNKDLIFHTMILLVLGLIPTMFSIALGFQSFISGNFYAMKEFANSMPLTSVFKLFKYPAIACAIKSKNKKTIVVTLILCILAILVNFSKFEIVLFMVTFVITINKYSSRKRKENRRLIALIFIGALVLLWSFSYYDLMRSGYDSASYFLEANRVSKSLNKKLVLPYLYLTTPWTNLQYVMETSKSYTYGLWMLKPFLGYFQLDNLFVKQYELVPMVPAFNTFSYITILFKDFGILGSGVVSFLLGLMIKKIYNVFRESTSPFLTAVYSLNSLAVLMMFFSNHFFKESYALTIIIIMLIYEVIFIRKKKKRDIKYEI